MLAAGRHWGGGPLLADVTDGVATELSSTALPRQQRQGLDSVSSDGENIAVSEVVSDAARAPATVWIGGMSADTRSEHKPPRDDEGRAPMWATPLLDGEEGFRSVGAVPVPGGWDIRAWRADATWESLDAFPQLRLGRVPAPRTLLSGTTESEVVVAGQLSERGPDAAAPWSVWTLGDDGPATPGGRWQRAMLASVPDGLTDIASWDAGWWVAGHRGMKPVVYDFDSAAGAELAVPDTSLDPLCPSVFVAGKPIGRSLVLATQSVDGPTVWLAAGHDWVRLPAPAGSLSAAQLVGDAIYVLVDGTLWFRALPPASTRADVQDLRSAGRPGDRPVQHSDA